MGVGVGVAVAVVVPLSLVPLTPCAHVGRDMTGCTCRGALARGACWGRHVAKGNLFDAHVNTHRNTGMQLNEGKCVRTVTPSFTSVVAEH